MSKRSYERRLKAKRERERAERKRAERIRKIRIWASVLAAIGLGLTLFFVFKGSGTVKPSASGTSPTPGASGRPIPGCTVPSPAPTPNGKQFSKPPANTIDTKNKIYVVTMSTSCGDIKIEMDPKVAPKTVNNFVFLANAGFYDGTIFHRVQAASGLTIVQGGDPKGTGTGGPGYSYDGETPPPGTSYARGVVAMANSGGPSSNGSQFFIVVRDSQLPPSYTVFGTVTDAASLAVLDRMATATGDPIQGGQLGLSPKPSIFLLKVTVAAAPRPTASPTPATSPSPTASAS
jgi:peptidyl-prolyl cis-trans isomerase B (cyclophilin B)